MKKLTYSVSVAQGVVHSSKQDVAPETQTDPDAFMRRLWGLCMLQLGVLVALMSLMAISYLELLQAPGLRFEEHGLLELTSLLAIVLGVFVTYVAWRCYLVADEDFLRWVVLVLLGLTLISLFSAAIVDQASIAFWVPELRGHLWWLAQAIFAAGFFLLSFNVVRAFQATRAFFTVSSQVEVVEQLREQQAQTRAALESLEVTNSLLRQQAATDWLTGVANRRHFMEHAKRVIARSRCNGTSVSLLCLDLDHFKQINDVHGHQAGDEVLKLVASTIAKNLRPSDLLARVGGEEFQALLPGANIEEAREIAERCRSALHDLEIPVRDKVVRVTVSMGCAQLGQDGDTLDSLIYVGDQRLYEAKELGRDRVVVEQAS